MRSQSKGIGSAGEAWGDHTQGAWGSLAAENISAFYAPCAAFFAASLSASVLDLALLLYSVNSSKPSMPNWICNDVIGTLNLWASFSHRFMSVRINRCELFGVTVNSTGSPIKRLLSKAKTFPRKMFSSSLAVSSHRHRYYSRYFYLFRCCTSHPSRSRPLSKW